MTKLMNKFVINKILPVIYSLMLLFVSGCTSDIQAAPLPSNTPETIDEIGKTATAIAPLVPTHTSTITPTLYPSSTPLPTNSAYPTPVPIPDEFYITNISGHRQYYAISCESSAAADWAIFFGVEVYESDIQFNLPISDNPDKGFVGDVNDPWGQVPPYSYGVHAAPIAVVLREVLNLPAQGVKNFTLEQLKNELASGQPVIAWVIGNVVGGFPAEFTDKDGDTTIVAAYEHTIIVTGYNAENIRYMNNGKFYEIPTDIFLNSWGVLGNMVVYYDD